MDARPRAYLAVVALMVAGIVLGQVIATALDISGVSRILICSAAIFVLSGCALGVLLFWKRSIVRR